MSRHASSTILSLGVLLLAGCEDSAEMIELVSGNNQSGAAGEALSQPLVVKVATAAGKGVKTVSVSWAVTAGDGSLSQTSALTDPQGQSSVIWTVGTVAGAENTAMASVEGLSGSPVTFTASVSATSPSRAERVSGDNQTGTVGAALSQPLVVRVRDKFGNTVPGATVNWTVATGGGSLSAGSTPTGADGQASVTWTLGSAAGANTAWATVQGLSAVPAVTFTATATPGPPSQVQATAGNHQSATVGETLPLALVVRVLDQFGNSIPGVTVSWAVTTTDGGSLSRSSTVTDAAGQTSVMWTLGTVAGARTVTATAGGGPAVTFTATAHAGPPVSFTKVAGDNQTGTAGWTLPESLTVRVADQYGNRVSGASVSWTVTSGGGSLRPTSTTTDPSGEGRTHWTLGALPGANGASAALEGFNPVTFAATGSPQPPTLGTGTATVDGVIAAGEWSAATQLDFDANLPEGGTTPATLFLMNDGSTLYVAVRFARDVADSAGILAVNFDTDNDGAQEVGDDGFGWTSSSAFFDHFYTTQAPCPPSNLCTFQDADYGGSKDGSGVFKNDGTYSVYELAHPLNSADDEHDFSLSPGQSVGVRVFLNIIATGRVFGITRVPGPAGEFLTLAIGQ